MSKKTKKLVYTRIKPLLAGLTTAGILGICFYVWTWQVKNNQTETFQNATNIMKDQATSKILAYEEVISNMRRLSGPEGIPKSDWDEYFQTIDLNNYKGLSGVSYSKLVSKSEKTAYERQYYRIFPARNKEEYMPVTYITPPTPEYMGFDTGTSSPERLTWITKARDSGELQRSDAYTFKANTTSEAVPLMFITVPIYRAGFSLTNTDERHKSYTGTIIGSLRLDQLVPALLAGIGSTNQFNDIEIYNSVDNGANLLYDSTPTRNSSSYLLHATIEVNMANRPLKITMGTDQKSAGELPSRKWLIAIAPLSIMGAMIARKKQI